MRYEETSGEHYFTIFDGKEPSGTVWFWIVQYGFNTESLDHAGESSFEEALRQARISLRLAVKNDTREFQSDGPCIWTPG